MPPAPARIDGETMQDAIARRIREHQATMGVDLSSFDTRQITHLWQYNLFPNATLLVNADLYAVLTARPRAHVGEAELVIVYFLRAPSPDAPRSRPIDVPLETEGGQHATGPRHDHALRRGVPHRQHAPQPRARTRPPGRRSRRPVAPPARAVTRR
jgi:hypothetical protein